MANVIIPKEHRSDYSKERDVRDNTRKSLDALDHRSRFAPSKDSAARGDYKQCKEMDKQMSAYREHKDPRVRAELKRNMDQINKEHRRGNG